MAEIKEDHNNGGMIAFLGSLGFVIAFFIYLVAIHPGVDLGENVRSPEVATADAGPAFDIATVKEPWKDNADVVKYGAKSYSANCAVCHGNEGKGDGPGGAALNPKPRNFVEGKWTKGGDSISLFETVSKGIAGTSMPPFGHFTAADRWALVQFIKSITSNKVADDEAKLQAFGTSAK